MRKLLALTLMTFAFAAPHAFAQETPADTAVEDAAAKPGSLKQHMKEAGTLFKAIGASIKDSSKNADNAQAAQKMSDLFKLVKNQIPDSFADIPEAHRAQALTEYQDMIQKTIDLVDQMAAAFLNNDNVKAEEIYRLLKDAKSEGHDRFDP